MLTLFLFSTNFPGFIPTSNQSHFPTSNGCGAEGLKVKYLKTITAYIEDITIHKYTMSMCFNNER